MNRTFFILLAFAATITSAFGQAGWSTSKVNAASVPQEVVSAQSTEFPGTSVTLWEKQTTTGDQGNSSVRYVANFMLSGAKTRARYSNTGQSLWATSYLTASQLPAAIVNAVKTNYSGYTLASGEKIMNKSKNQTIYRVRARKKAQKLVLYLDESGNEVSKNQVPAEAQQD